MAEEEIAQEADKLVRGLLTAAGQLREHMARRSANKDRVAADAARAEAERATGELRNQHEATKLLYERVQRNSFWNSADAQTIADIASYGALNSHLDPTANELYQIVREKVAEKYGIDVNALRAANPLSEEARNDALRHALDDKMAAQRDDDSAERDREAATRLEDAEHDAANTNPEDAAEAGEKAEELAADAQDHDEDHDLRKEHEAGDYAQARELEQPGDGPGINTATSRNAQQAARAASVSYPNDAQSTLVNSSGRTRVPSRTRKRTAQKTSELSK